jgi:hypothetical protein
LPVGSSNAGVSTCRAKRGRGRLADVVSAGRSSFVAIGFLLSLPSGRKSAGL